MTTASGHQTSAVSSAFGFHLRDALTHYLGRIFRSKTASQAPSPAKSRRQHAAPCNDGSGNGPAENAIMAARIESLQRFLERERSHPW
jgi:hypothetical protein